MPEQMYSQHGEDLLLLEVFRDQRDGFYIEVGAFDGVYLSNTKALDDRGWRGVCVEPHPRFFAQLEANRPDAVCIQAACVGDPELTEIVLYAEPHGVLSSTVDGLDADIEGRYERNGLEFPGLEETPVRARTLDSILAELAAAPAVVDVLSIDVEGAEVEVLKGLDVDRWRPRVLLLEANDAAAENALDEYVVQSLGYTEARRLGVNIFYAREDELAVAIRDAAWEVPAVASSHPNAGVRLGRGAAAQPTSPAQGVVAAIRARLSRLTRR